MLWRFGVFLLYLEALSVVSVWASVPRQSIAQERILRNFHFEPFVLKGRMRTEERSYLLEVVTEGNQMVYHFTEMGLYVRVQFSSGKNVVWIANSMDGPWKALPKDRYRDRILDSDATYEDLAFNFIHWGEVSALGEDSIKTIPAIAYEAKAPGKGSGYHRIRYWVGAETYALLRADAFNETNQVVKRLEVNGVMRLGDVVTIKELQISTLIPGRDLSASRTYIEFKSAERRPPS